jgi:hypothetical protein
VAKVTAGEPLKIPASVWNNLMDAEAAHRGTALGNGGNGLRYSRNYDLVKLRAAVTVARDDVLEIGDPTIDPDSYEDAWRSDLPAYEGDTPAGTGIHGRIAVMIEPAAAGKFGLAVASGVVRCTVDVQDAGHGYARAVAGYTRLESTDDSGAPCEILHAPADETGEQLCLIRVSNSRASLVELCLAEDHPGRSIAFDAKLGHWSPAADNWCYDSAPTVKAIDHRYGAPFPDAGARGLFLARPSTEHGIIYECVSLDCESPGTCPECEE